jgi:hypothetical protein
VLNRVDNLASQAGQPQDSAKYVAYTYLGAGTIVQAAHPAVSGGLTLSYGSAEANHPGLDGLGRVVEQKWTDGSGSAVRDHYQYGYDRASSRVWRKNVLAPSRGELYAYDELGRLLRAGRGTLNDSNDGLTTTVMRQNPNPMYSAGLPVVR